MARARTLKLPLLAALAAAIGWSAFTYPAIGQLTYDLASAAESRLYGLHKERVTVDGVPMVFYRSQGRNTGQNTGQHTGDAILMLHGFSADKDVWARFARHFTGNHQVIVPDLAGHGETGYQPDWKYSIPAQSERLVKLLDQLGVQRVHVIGNSMGGHLAAYFALHHPKRTLSAAMVDPAGLLQPHPSEMERMRAEGHNPFLFDTRAGFHRFYPMTMAQPPFMPGYVLDAIADQYIARKAALTQIFNESHQPTDVSTRLGQLRAPALIVWGKQDRLIDVSAAAVWQAALPKAQVVLLDGIGHMPMVEAPADTAKLYAAFIDQAGTR